MVHVLRVVLTALVLSSSLWAVTTAEYISWIKPSRVDAVWQKVDEDTYSLLEVLPWPETSVINNTTYSVGQYGGELAITVREYVQPGGLPGFNFMHVYAGEGNARFNQGVVGYTYLADFRQQIEYRGTGTDAVGDFHWWLIKMAYTGNATRTIRVDSCFSYSYGTGEYCKQRTMKIRGLN